MAPMLFITSWACVFLLSCLVGFANARPERGKWINGINKDQLTLWYVKSLYSGSQISVEIQCQSDAEVRLNISWVLRRSPCAQEYIGLNSTIAKSYLQSPQFLTTAYKETEYLNATVGYISCHKSRHLYIHPFNYTKPTVTRLTSKKTSATKTDEASTKTSGTEATAAADVSAESGKDGSAAAQPGKDGSAAAQPGKDGSAPAAGSESKPLQEGGTGANRKRREADSSKVTSSTPKPVSSSPAKAKTGVDYFPDRNENDADRFLKVWKDGYYVLILEFSSADSEKPLPDKFHAEITVRMTKDDNYISAADWPLLIFYGMMGLVYIGYGIFWLFMLACNWRDLLRVQFWVGGVILLGMLEKAVFFAEYENINKEGQPVQGAIILAELVSCVKRGLARMLVIIVCLGFGIIKPRLGQTLHKVLIAGVVYIILASIEGCMRATKERPDQSTEWMFAAVPLAVTDAIICWWIFSALLQTTRTLRLRRNVVKLSLYRHFTNTLIFAILASIAYMIWFLTQHRFKDCITDWKELWVDEAFWHLLFSVILLIIMILWRPTANNQRYAFSPLLDAAEDDIDDDQVLSEAYEGMKMRTTKTQQRNGSPRGFEDTERKMEDDLKWVEENIPSSLADKLLPALDSDEEIMNQKFEVSKMD
ncbi:transmembrane protein 87A [Aplysia californica]|uniref:Transmembrane protein 87A n=1 Tax=Aplysia californica TaxID=6500 RepID=A0ABM0ZUN0_APLCA|nr:transmembrane protein 87A [Aplysia californica]